ncbi:hypothetical protein Pd630_LPD14013 (plasmid) [Rhodococcus opacus PD630]|nr:hypothetical protein Pd630_LPD14013 [Rhodococcus opacus PD630]
MRLTMHEVDDLCGSNQRQVSAGGSEWPRDQPVRGDATDEA